MAKKYSVTWENDAIQFPKLIFPLFLGIAILMWAIFAVATVVTSRAMSREKTTTGVVLDMVVRRDSEGNEYYYPVVEFKLADGRFQRLETAEGHYPPAYYAGQQVQVLYDPDQPLYARIKSTSSTITRWTMSIIFAVLGIAFVAASFFVRWILKEVPGTASEKVQAGARNL
jgi:hypothetical protein